MSADFTHVRIVAQAGMDVGWITQEVCQEYAKAVWDDLGEIVKNGYADTYLVIATNNDQSKIEAAKTALLKNPFFKDLIEEVREELGIPLANTIEWNAWILQKRLDSGRYDGKEMASLYSRLFELRGWAAKPHERAGVGPAAVGSDSDEVTEKFDRFNTKEPARKYAQWISASS